MARPARTDVLIGAQAALFGAAGTAVWQGPVACVAAAALGAALGRARERAQLHRGTLDARTRGGRAEAIALLPVTAVA